MLAVVTHVDPSAISGVLHVVHRSLNDLLFTAGSMNHLTVAYVDASVLGINHDVSGLRIGYTLVPHVGIRCAESRGSAS